MAYKKDTDYQELINRAVDSGDFTAAAKYEQQRNEKILGEGLDYETTNEYGAYLTEPRVEFEKPTYETTERPKAPSYDSGYSASAPSYDSVGDRPVYDSAYDDQIETALRDLLGREEFHYDTATDPLFRQYESIYNREGDRAYQNTMASLASGAGGMNTYAATAAQQANDYYRAKLGDAVPQLYQLAWSMYRDDVNDQRADLNTLLGMRDDEYGRYLDSLNQWNKDRSFAYGRYRDQVSDWENDRNFAYNQYRDAMDDYLWAEQFNYATAQDAYANAAAAAKQRKTYTGPAEEPETTEVPDYVKQAANWMSDTGKDVRTVVKWMKNSGYTAEEAAETLNHLGYNSTNADYLLTEAGYRTV